MFEGYYNSGGATQYTYCVPGPLNSNCTSSSAGFDPAGNLTNVIDSVTGTWTYRYETLNRVLTGTASGGPVSGDILCWTYDSFGNRTSESLFATACNNNPPLWSWAATYTTSNTNRMDSTSTNSNQINGYDAAGNITFDGLYKYLYDGEGRVCASLNTVSGTMYGYI